MKTRLMPIKFISLCLLAACAETSQQSRDFYLQGMPSYQLSAADVFRLNKAYPELKLTRHLRPLFNQTFYSEGEFKHALNQYLPAEQLATVYPSLQDKALLAAESVHISVLADDVLRIRFGQTQAQTNKLADFDALIQPSTYHVSEDSVTTAKLKAEVDGRTLCVKVSKSNGEAVNMLCPNGDKQISLRTVNHYDYQGLGQEFQQPGVIDGRWNGRVRQSGNQMSGFNGGATGNTQFPILYAASSKQSDFALYLNNIYNTRWDFSRETVTIKPVKGERDLLLMVADEQKTLREQYMSLVGKPLVPPRKMFGLWLSEYGFDNWQEMDDKLATLHTNQFPIDGVVMDLQWFGNVQSHDENSHMGTLRWDEENFPQPKQKIAQLKQQGVGMMLIEESYVSSGREEHQQMEAKGFLARDPLTGKAINTNPTGGGHWWGKGGMIDWSNPDAGQFWHEWKRQPLIDMGIIGHWTDLGEPEMYNSKGVYYQDKPHDDIHNLYNYDWLKSIYLGYQQGHNSQRPFMMSRSGAPGMQKFGAVMWSADIGSNLTSLAVHAGQQTNMMLSGMDYYGSDIGGFHRGGLGVAPDEIPQVLNETYTQWFAYSSMFDVPVRPHTENLCNCKETAPDRVGDLASNRGNIELRYELIPYLYSLAHRAHQYGEAVFSSVAYQFPNDENAAKATAEKMVGESLLSSAVAQLGAKETALYLPKAHWFDYRTGEDLGLSSGESKSFALYQQGQYRLPLLAAEGAIIPFAPKENEVSSQVPTQLGVKIFGQQDASFTLFEDDGLTQAYLNGEIRRTELSVKVQPKQVQLHIRTQGDYTGAPEKRSMRILWALDSREVQAVQLNGQPLDSWKRVGHWLEIDTPELATAQEHLITVI
ncbi:TIM-barrel domain-containing protein [Vibrio cidicii]